ncbi:glycosyltransferase involved in cell wall biosynthesis [Pedobacter sp. CAN_A7]|uniref:glycosyltransferase n=1 Tax=Pedobacter sp. CAN_A7 TaxID=2787722 RepID=UPI0018CBC651
MANDVKLALVIPAFKGRYFKAALDSIAQQNCKLFNLYIGDDASPEDLGTLVEAYQGDLNITYKRFPENLGSKNLVAHWERCINLTQDEEWVWLFSDDDVMGSSCVQNFYDNVNGNGSSTDLFHINLNFINGAGGITKECKPFPLRLSVSDFFFRRIKFQINSSVVEYIFRKTVYVEKNGFKNNEMAWCSDDATWLKFGEKKGITTIPGIVYWRISGENISSMNSDKNVVIKKITLNIKHIKWATNFLKSHNLVDQTKPFDKIKWIISTLVVTPGFSFKERYQVLNKVINELEFHDTKLLASSYLVYWEIKNFLLGYQKP